MKKTFVAAALAAFVLTSCGENKQETTGNDHAQHEGMEHADSASVEPTTTAVVVEVPDYSSAAAPVKSQLEAIVSDYMKVKDGLVASNAQNAQTGAKAILAAAEKVDVSALGEEQKTFAEEKLGEVKQSASKIAESADLAAQRGQLELLSEATFALAKAFGVSSQTLYYQHCPMANNDQGAYWLSTDSKIRNPYFGDAMLTCGSNEEIYTKK